MKRISELEPAEIDELVALGTFLIWRQPMSKTPFNSPRDPAQPPYHLRNGTHERAEADRHEAEHRLRLGMGHKPGCPRMSGAGDPPCICNRKGRPEFDAWTKGHAIEFSERELSMCWLAWQAAQS